MADAATAEPNAGIDFDEERLESAGQAHETELEEMGQDRRVARHMDLDGNYVKPETRFDWGEEDKMAQQLAAVAEWPLDSVRQFREELEDINEDGRLSEKGEREKKEQLAREYLEADSGGAERGGSLVRARYEAKRFTGKIEKRAAELTPFEEPDPNDARSATREREIRDHVRSIEDPADRMQAARKLVDSGDPEAMRAILDAPPGMAPLTEQNMENLRNRALQNRHGSAPEEVAALRKMAKVVERNVEEARREIASLAGMR